MWMAKGTQRSRGWCWPGPSNSFYTVFILFNSREVKGISLRQSAFHFLTEAKVYLVIMWPGKEDFLFPCSPQSKAESSSQGTWLHFAIKDRWRHMVHLGPTRDWKDPYHKHYWAALTPKPEKCKAYPLPQPAYLWGGKARARQPGYRSKKRRSGTHSRWLRGQGSRLSSRGTGWYRSARGPEEGNTSCGRLAEEAKPVGLLHPNYQIFSILFFRMPVLTH